MYSEPPLVTFMKEDGEASMSDKVNKQPEENKKEFNPPYNSHLDGLGLVVGVITTNYFLTEHEGEGRVFETLGWINRSC